MRLSLSVLLFTVASWAYAGEDAGFPDAKHKAGQLTHVAGVPVLIVRGSPAEIGEQFGVLAIKNAPALRTFRQQFLQDAGVADQEFFLKLMAQRLQLGIPEPYRKELTAAATAGGWPLVDLLFANTVYDLSSNMGCSTIVVDPARSATGKPLFARNFDWLPTPMISQHTLIAVFHPTGKRAFATITITPITGCITGMNDAGLTVAINEIPLRESADHSRFHWDGVPMLFAFRQVLEECRTISEAEQLLRKLPRTTSACMTICDSTGGAVLELTPKTVFLRHGDQAMTCCTNHFQSEKLASAQSCWRLPQLEKVFRLSRKPDVADLFVRLDAAHQGKATLQSMVLEPARRTLHLKYGNRHGSATRLPRARVIDFTPFFKD
ncbi:MAG: C45 family peptidase [Bacteroidales bacterium]|nr:C45 family peptidase [Bacteroidales bacterium]